MSNLINNGSIEPKVFESEFGSIRVIMTDKLEFCLKDVCVGLNISDTNHVSKAIRLEFGEEACFTRPVMTKGGKQKLVFILEEHLVFALMRSNKSSTLSFRRWVMNELLPSLKTTKTDITLNSDINITSFNFEGFELGYGILNGDPLFHLNTIAEYLGIANPRASVNIEDSDYVIKVDNSVVSFTYNRILNNRGELFLTEAGFYRLVLRSNKPKAEKFIKWVTKEVIPTIRKTGHYGFKPMTLKDSLKLNLELLEKNEVLTAENKELKVELKYQTEKADNYDYTEKERRSKQELVTKFNKTVRTLAEQKFECNYAGAYTYVYNEFDKLHCINQPINLEFLKKNNDYLAECLKIATNELD